MPCHFHHPLSVLTSKCNICSFLKSKTDSAIQKALDADPSCSGAQCCIGKALLITHDYVRAVEYFRNALQSSPQYIELRLELARLYIKLKRNQEAIDTLTPALKFREDRDRRTNTLWNNTNPSHGQCTTDSMDADIRHCV